MQAILRDPSCYYPSLLSKISVEGPEKLNDASNEAQALRRVLICGSNVLIVQVGYTSKRFIYDRLKKLGVQVVIMDALEIFWKQMEKEGVIVDFLPLGFTDNAKVFERAMEIIGTKMRSGFIFV